MRFDLTTPCENCPFRTDATAIRFRTRERAEEIEESAYRNGFPCHKTAEHRDEEDCGIGEEDGFVFRENGKTQHCVGALIMFALDGYDSTPGIGNDEDIMERVMARADPKAPVFETVEDFLNANTKA